MRLVTIICALLVSGCAIQVKTYQNPDTDFTAYETWCWMQGCEFVYQGPEYYKDEKVITEISNAVAWNMHDKGYLQSDEQSDLVVNFYVIMEEDSIAAVSAYSSNFADQWLSTLYPEYDRFLKGNLVIDVIERKTSSLLWTSQAVKYMEINPTYDKELIWNGVSRAMKRFPVKN